MEDHTLPFPIAHVSNLLWIVLLIVYSSLKLKINIFIEILVDKIYGRRARAPSHKLNILTKIFILAFYVMGYVSYGNLFTNTFVES